MSQPSITFEHVRKRAIEKLSDAQAMAKDRSRNDPQIIHDLRVAAKHLRAWWRLMRGILSETQWDQADHRVKEFARCLASARDQHVQQQTLNRLVHLGSDDAKPNRHLATLQAQWLDSQTVVVDQVMPDWDWVNELIQAELNLWESLTWPDLSPTQQNVCLMDRFKNTYRKGQILSRAVAIESDISTCHLWRKWVKYLLYQLALLSDVEPKLKLNKTLVRLHTIADYLGDHHDFSMLAQQLHEQSDTLDTKAVKRVLKLIAQEQKDLIRHANKKARHVFADQPGVWVKTLS